MPTNRGRSARRADPVISSTASFKGGRPTIPVARPLLPTAAQLLPYLSRIDAARIYTNHGPLVLELRSRLAQHLSMPDGAVVCASSGTSALVGAIIAAAGRASPERPLAIVPAFTFAATAAATEQCGYRPYLADVDAADWMLDPGKLASHPMLGQVGLVVPVAPFGRPLPLSRWTEFRCRTGIPVVVDAAASFVAVSQEPGCRGEIPVCLSFHATKCFSTGEGGAVVCTDTELVRRTARTLNFGVLDVRDCRSPGTNGKMSEYHAAIGLAQLDGWDDRSAMWAEMAARYRTQFENMGLADALHTMPQTGPNYVLLRCPRFGVDRILECLAECGVDYRYWYGAGLHRQSYYAELPRDDLNVTDGLATRLVGLPTAPDLPQAAISRIAAAVARGMGPVLAHRGTGLDATPG